MSNLSDLDHEGIRRWSRLLERTASGRLRDETLDAADIDAFVDDHGDRRSVDGPFLAALLGVPAPERDQAPLDVRLWTAAARGENVSLEALDATGALSTQGKGEPIEVWTETELSSLHALWRIGRWTGREDVRDRALESARWHVAETQADHATNHPWAVHVFVVAGAMGAPEGFLYADGLLHASQVGAVDRLSALILRDAARELSLMAGEGPGGDPV